MGRNVRLQTQRIGHEPKLSQQQVADRAGIALNRYWKIENGYTQPTVDEQNAIAEIFGMKPSDIFATSEALAS